MLQTSFFYKQCWFSCCCIALFIGCNPWQAVYDREIQWRNDVHTKTNIDLPELNVSRPLRHAPRVIIRSDSISFDNRAWWLSLPDEFFLTTNHPHYNDFTNEDKRSLIIEETVLELNQGRIQFEGTEKLDQLQEVLSRQSELNRSTGTLLNLSKNIEEPEEIDNSEPSAPREANNTSLDLTIINPLSLERETSSEQNKPRTSMIKKTRHLNREEQIQRGINTTSFYPQVQIIAERNIPLITIKETLNIVGQHYLDMTLTGAHDGVVSGVTTQPNLDLDHLDFKINWWDLYGSNKCSMIIEKDRSWIQCDSTTSSFLEEKPPPNVPKLSLEENCNSSDPKALLKALYDLQISCFTEDTRSAHYPWYYTKPEWAEPPTDEADDSLQMYVLAHEEISYGDWVDAMQSSHDLYPQIKLYYYPITFSTNPSGQCEHSVALSKITAVQKDALCHQLFAVGEDKMEEAFPDFHSWRQARMPKKPDLEEADQPLKRRIESLGSTNQNNLDSTRTNVFKKEILNNDQSGQGEEQ